MLSVRTTLRVGTIFFTAMSFCIVTQSYLHSLFSHRELALITPNEITGKSETGNRIQVDNRDNASGGLSVENVLNDQIGFEIWNKNTTTSKDSQVKTRINRKKKNRRRRRRGYDDDIERAMFVILMGEKAAKTKTIERFVYSARKTGKYNGWIVVLTDAPAGRFDGMKNWTDNVIVMEPKEEDLKTHYNVSNMIYKRFKTLAIDYMDRDSRLNDVELVYYLDADIVFGDNMKQAFKGLETTYGIGRLGVNAAANSTNLGRGKMWMFKGNSQKWHIQGGQIILERRNSNPCLERWRKGFDDESTASMGKDQYLLMDIKREMDEARDAFLNDSKRIPLECEIVMMEQKPYIEFPLVKNIRKASKKLTENPKKKYKYLPMVHVRNDGGTADMKDKSIKPYIRHLLGFKKGDKDPLGITKKVKMETTTNPPKPKKTEAPAETAPTTEIPEVVETKEAKASGNETDEKPKMETKEASESEIKIEAAKIK